MKEGMGKKLKAKKAKKHKLARVKDVVKIVVEDVVKFVVEDVVEAEGEVVDAVKQLDWNVVKLRECIVKKPTAGVKNVVEAEGVYVRGFLRYGQSCQHLSVLLIFLFPKVD